MAREVSEHPVSGGVWGLRWLGPDCGFAFDWWEPAPGVDSGKKAALA